MKQRVIALANQKGGVGKTTSAVNLAMALAIANRRVCLIDTDSQANASAYFGLDPKRPSEDGVNTIFDVVLKKAPASSALIKINENLDLLPSSKMFAVAETELANVKVGRETRMAKAVEELTDYHYIIIDTPPNLGLITINALMAADEAFAVVQSEPFAFEGLTSFAETVEMVQEHSSKQLRISGVIITKYSKGKKIHRCVEETTRENYGDLVFKTQIRENVKLTETTASGQDIFNYDPTSIGAQDYASLAQEVIAMEQGE